MPSKQINKDDMFRKIMPSAGGEVSSQVSSENTEPALDDNKDVRVQHTGAVLNLSPRAAAERVDTGEPYPINVTELLMEKYYPAYREKLEGCTCNRCKDDIFGIALNKISTCYMASDRFKPADLLNRELITETVTALVRALFIVKRNPHHEKPTTLG